MPQVFAMLALHFLNHSFLKVEAEPGIEQELSDYLTFDVPGAQYMPVFKKGFWDGKARLYQLRYHTTYTGLAAKIQAWALQRGYPCEVDPKLSANEMLREHFDWHEFFQTHTTNLPFTPDQYQLEAVKHALAQERCLIVSPTGSGKSLIIYLLAMMLAVPGKRMLVVVPTISLVNQLAAMLVQYGYPHTIQTIAEGAGRDLVDDAPIVISTWQSIYKLPAEWYHHFRTIIGDEVHTFKAKSLSSMMEKAIKTRYRIGLTGTLDDTKVHEWLLEGLFGPVYVTTKTHQLIEAGRLAKIDVQQIVLKHPAGRLFRGSEYRDELNYLAENEARNRFIRRLALTLTGNTLILFTLVERQGKPLFADFLTSSEKARNVVFVYGGTASWQREKVREISANEENVIIVASYGVFSTGIDIARIHNIIFASPSKSRIRVLQSIGRGTRKSVDKLACTVYDIADAVPTPGRKSNFTLEHARIRAEYYLKEKFPLEQYVVPLP